MRRYLSAAEHGSRWVRQTIGDTAPRLCPGAFRKKRTCMREPAAEVESGNILWLS